MSTWHIQENQLSFNVLDVPRNQFLVGGKVWQMYRNHEVDPDTFGVEPESDIKGEWFIRHKLIQDVATQRKMELLLWDC